ncbi:MAG: 30S ribosomal protein S16 [Halobacteriovoraceae bacterium]|nr:30S ribosomal protein S16 [Halobacteriovoraceae bacterium]
MVVIRLARGGRPKRPVYTVVAADSRRARDGRFLAKLGQYNPHGNPFLMGIKMDEINQYLQKGARISHTVRTLLKKDKKNINPS